MQTKNCVAYIHRNRHMHNTVHFLLFIIVSRFVLRAKTSAQYSLLYCIKWWTRKRRNKVPNKYFFVDGGKYHEFYQYNSIEVYLLVISVDQSWWYILVSTFILSCHCIELDKTVGMRGAILISAKLMIDFIFVESKVFGPASRYC